MAVEKLVLPVCIGFAALCLLATVALVLRSRRSREQDKMSAEDRERLAESLRRTWRRRLAVISLGIAFVIIFCIAGIAAWLSFGAQKAYAFDRNGGSWDAATGFALLLDAGALGLSLLRLFEALTARSSQMTRIYLVLFIVASATMNLLHAPHNPGEAPSLGGRLVAVIPPLVYAVFLETLLKKVEQLVLGKYPTRKTKKNVERGYSLLLWVPFVGYPWQMWKKWREDLHGTLQYVRAPGSRKPLPSSALPPEPQAEERVDPHGTPRAAVEDPTPSPVLEAGFSGSNSGARPTDREAPSASASEPPVRTSVQAPPPAAGERSKKELLRDALVAQIRNGDLTVLDTNSQVSNAAAYRVNMRLGKDAGKGTDRKGRQEGLMADGAVRTAVKQLLPGLRQVAEKAEQARRAAAAAPRSAPEPAPDHRAIGEDETTGGDASRERWEKKEKVPA
ncbi:DUF2637 domain-containing protein [Streptomyces niveus]|uniref:DUF2637 domain-containing protein n=1 Tax=Streptomyces niveus TaxID=193462 RepID=UPI0036AAFD1F